MRQYLLERSDTYRIIEWIQVPVTLRNGYEFYDRKVIVLDLRTQDYLVLDWRKDERSPRVTQRIKRS